MYANKSQSRLLKHRPRQDNPFSEAPVRNNGNWFSGRNLAIGAGALALAGAGAYVGYRNMPTSLGNLPYNVEQTVNRISNIRPAIGQAINQVGTSALDKVMEVGEGIRRIGRSVDRVGNQAGLGMNRAMYNARYGILELGNRFGRTRQSLGRMGSRFGNLVSSTRQRMGDFVDRGADYVGGLFEPPEINIASDYGYGEGTPMGEIVEQGSRPFGRSTGLMVV